MGIERERRERHSKRGRERERNSVMRKINTVMRWRKIKENKQ